MLIAQIWLETNLITSGETLYFGKWGGIFRKTLTFLLLLNFSIVFKISIFYLAAALQYFDT